MTKWLLLAPLVLLAGCASQPQSYEETIRQIEQERAEAEKYCAPILVTKADGVSLYKVSSECPRVGWNPVYFSVNGTQTSESYHTGKIHHTRTVQVPNGQ